MTDKELLELAAKASGIEVWFPRMNGGANKDGTRIILTPCHTEKEGEIVEWNPLTDDGDALRLAVKLGLAISIDIVEKQTHAHHEHTWKAQAEDWEDQGPCAATRRAIVRAAAEIGKEMK